MPKRPSPDAPSGGLAPRLPQESFAARIPPPRQQPGSSAHRAVKLLASSEIPFLRLAQEIFRSAPGERHDCQRRVLVRIGHKWRAIGDEQILDIVRLAIAM